MNQKNTSSPVAIVMGSQSDWPTMQLARDVLAELGVSAHCEVVSAHRTPEKMFEFAKSASDQGYKVIIAGAGGAAHLPGMISSMTILPVLGVPIKSRALNGIDSLLSIAQMPSGVPVGTLAIGESGAKNAGLLAARILALSDSELASKIYQYAQSQTDAVMSHSELEG